MKFSLLCMFMVVLAVIKYSISTNTKRENGRDELVGGDSPPHEEPGSIGIMAKLGKTIGIVRRATVTAFALQSFLSPVFGINLSSASSAIKWPNGTVGTNATQQMPGSSIADIVDNNMHHLIPSSPYQFQQLQQGIATQFGRNFSSTAEEQPKRKQKAKSVKCREGKLALSSIANECKKGTPATTSSSSDNDNIHQQQFKANYKRFNPNKVAINAHFYPQAPRGNAKDNYHGQIVADPYRTLEDPEAEATKQFVANLNKISKPYLDASPVREKLRERLTKLWDYEKSGIPAKHGDFYYYYHNTGLQDQYVLYKRKLLEDDHQNSTVFLDPNTFSEDGTTALTMGSFSKDGSLYAYGISEKGSDWATVKFKKCTGEELADKIEGVKFSALSWLNDSSGLFYSKYPEMQGPAVGSTTTKLQYHSLFFHKIGTNSTEDIMVVQMREQPDLLILGGVSTDGHFLFVSFGDSGPNNQLFYYDLAVAGHKINGLIELRPLFDKADASYSVIDSDQNSALVHTNKDAPMYKLIRVKLNQTVARNADPDWKIIIAEDPKRTLEIVRPVDEDKMLVCYMEDVKDSLYVHDLNTGHRLYQIPLPVGATIDGISVNKTSSSIFISTTSFVTPYVIYQADFADCPTRETPVQLREYCRPDLPGLNSDSFVVKQVFYKSKDGTKVPMYIIHRKDMVLDGTNPVLLYGYGGFGVSQLPSFSLTRLMFIQHFGGVSALPNLRGGSEYGENWHEAGMRDNKQNVFDDFISAAEFLIRENYTSREKLAIYGASNGGLLTAACSQQRPDLFGAVISQVGVLDMLRFNKFTVGATWVPEFGNPDSPDDFTFLYKYSPLHQLKLRLDQQWPATLLISADHDDRVVPLHTLKYVAQLYHLLRTQAHASQRNPVLAKIEVKAGHGAGKPTTKTVAYLLLKQIEYV